MKFIVLGFIVLGVVALGYNFFTNEDYPDTATMVGQVNVQLAEHSALGIKGQEIFEANCATCHGENAAGGEGGPPLVHEIYNPGHHGDGAFLSAVMNGVPQHHWNFGNMPAQEGLTRLHVAAIVKYIRELQLANGVVFKPHNM